MFIKLKIPTTKGYLPYICENVGSKMMGLYIFFNVFWINNMHFEIISSSMVSKSKISFFSTVILWSKIISLYSSLIILNSRSNQTLLCFLTLYHLVIFICLKTLKRYLNSNKLSKKLVNFIIETSFILLFNSAND